MDHPNLQPSLRRETDKSAKSRRLGRIALAVVCTSVLILAPFSEAAARFGRGGGHPGSWSHPARAWAPPSRGENPKRWGEKDRRLGETQPRWSENEPRRGENLPHWSENPPRRSENPPRWAENPHSRGENPPRWAENPPRWAENPPRRGEMDPDPGRGIQRSPWHNPIYGDSTPPSPTPTSQKDPSDAPPPTNWAQSPKSNVPSENERRFVPDEVLFTTSGPAQTVEAIAQKHRLTLISSRPIGLIGTTLQRYRITDRRAVPDVIRDLETEQQITSVQPNYIFKLESADANARSLGAAQYAIDKLHLTEAQAVTQGDGTLVAVIDSGIDESHPEIAGSVVDRFDVLGGEPMANTHGTAIAGIIAAHGALLGVAPHANLLSVRAFAGSGARPGADGTSAHIVEALNWAYEHKARIVNMSFAGAYDPLLARAIGTAYQKGLILVAAAGNEGPTAEAAYPASDANVIAVTATDRDDKLYSAANHGAYICVAAPGTDIIVAAPPNAYQFSSGTSLAAAHISGLIALLLSEKPDLSAAMVRKVLTETTRNLGAPGPNEEFGAGLSDAARAVTVVKDLRDRQLAGEDVASQLRPGTLATR